MSPKYSIVIPVYNRPQEVEELLDSLLRQVFRDFEVLIVEDGSSVRCDDVVDRFAGKLNVKYFFKPNTGPGPSRNFGYAHARGDYFVVFDSDCIVPPAYFQEVEDRMAQQPLDAWGGPDRAHQEFTYVQRAMGYTMSSVLTTGGIRGSKKHVGWFQPRSFNMGISRKVFEQTGGFHFDRYAEDIEFSIRIRRAGFKVGLIPEAFVYHKRRTTFGQFYRQVANFGKGRVLVGKAYPEELKVAHWFPAFFVAGLFIAGLLPLISPVLSGLALGGYIVYLFAIFLHATIVSKNLIVGLLSVPAALIQLGGYGIGFLKEWVNRADGGRPA